jgi:hypothetical protein
MARLALGKKRPTRDLFLFFEEDMVSARAGSRRLTGGAGVCERRAQDAGC